MWSGNYELVQFKKGKKQPELSPLLDENFQDVSFFLGNSIEIDEAYTSLDVLSDDDSDPGDLSSVGIIKTKKQSDTQTDISQVSLSPSEIEFIPPISEAQDELESLSSEPEIIEEVDSEAPCIESSPSQPSTNQLLSPLKSMKRLFSRDSPPEVKTVDGVFSNLSAKPQILRNLDETSSIRSQSLDVISIHSFRDDLEYDPEVDGQDLPEYEQASLDPPPHFDSVNFLPPFLFDLSGGWAFGNEPEDTLVLQAVCLVIMIILIILFILAQIATSP